MEFPVLLVLTDIADFDLEIDLLVAGQLDGAGWYRGTLVEKQLLFEDGADAAQRDIVEVALHGFAVLAPNRERHHQTQSYFDTVRRSTLAVIKTRREIGPVEGDAGLTADFLHMT